MRNKTDMSSTHHDMTKRQYCDDLEKIINDVISVDKFKTSFQSPQFNLDADQISKLQLNTAVTLAAVHGTYCGDVRNPEFAASLNLITQMKLDTNHDMFCQNMPSHVFCKMTDVIAKIATDVECESESHL